VFARSIHNGCKIVRFDTCMCSADFLISSCESGSRVGCQGFDNILGDRGHTPNDGGVGWIAQVLPSPLRLLARNKD